MMTRNLYGTPSSSAITKAEAPMTGGVTCPPHEAEASTAAAKRAVKPYFFISGIVSDPVVTALATGEPEIIPNSPDDTTHTFAGPPEKRPAAIVARSMNSRPRPVICASTPNSTKWKT